MEASEMNRDEEVRQLAYSLWQDDGYPDGYDVQHWLKAEMIWQAHHSQSESRQSQAPKEKKQDKSRGA